MATVVPLSLGNYMVTYHYGKLSMGVPLVTYYYLKFYIVIDKSTTVGV